MEWQLMLLMILGTFLILLLSGMPVAFCFMLLNVVGVFLFWGGESGLRQLTVSFYASVTTFTLLPVPLFVLMGEAMFRSGLAPRMIDALDKWLGRVPGRLSLLAVGGGTVFAALSGSSIAGVAMLGSTLVPEMEKRGYKKPMTIGPILGSGGIATMIPPSALAVLLASIGEISVGRILIAIIGPGILMSIIFVTYIVVRCRLQPQLAPSYELSPSPFREKVASTAKYVLPLGFIVFLVIGSILLGVASPTEASALGVVGTFILAAVYRRVNWEMVKGTIFSTIEVTVMIFMIIVGAKAFAQILAFTGASRGLVELATSLPLEPIVIIIAMQVAVLLLGCFMEVVSIMMITLPIFMPVVLNLGFDPVWFGAIMMLNIEIAIISPPFGTSLFAMKGVAPPDTTMGDIYRAALPFVGLDLLTMALIIAFPAIALWLPGIMR